MQFGDVAVPHRSQQDREGQSVDLKEDDPRRIRARLLPLPARDAPDYAQHVGVVVVGAEDDLEDDARGSDHERRQQRPAK